MRGFALALALWCLTQSGAAAGVIAGRVVDATTGAAVADASVTLRTPAGPQRSTRTDAEGRYAFPALPAGRYNLTAERAGYMRGLHGRVTPFGRSEAIDLLADQHVGDATLLMWRFASISGRVVDDGNDPVVGVRVRALKKSSRAGLTLYAPAWEGAEVVTTDDRGRYRFGRMPPGEYVIAVPARVNLLPATSTSGSPRNPGVADMTPGGDRVTVFQSTFHLRAADPAVAAVIAVAAGQTVEGIDVQLDAVPTFSISGRLQTPAGPLASTTFYLHHAGGPPFDDNEFAAAVAQTDALGRFTVPGVPAGRYILRVAPRVSPAGSPRGAAARYWLEEDVVVTDADLRDLQFTARRVATLTGRFPAPTPATLAGEQLIIVQPLDPGPAFASNPRLDAQGGFTTEALPNRYNVLALIGMHRCRVLLADKDISDEPITIDDADVAGLTVDCAAKPTELTGTIRNQRGDIDAHARVVAFSTDRRHWTGTTRRLMRFGEAGGTNAGAFSLTSLPPGEYFVAAIADDVLDWQDTNTLERLATAAAKLDLRRGESQKVELRTVAISR